MTRPWAARAEALTGEHGAWADFCAWEDWWGEHMAEYEAEHTGNGTDVRYAMTEMGMIRLYCLMCDVADRQQAGDKPKE